MAENYQFETRCIHGDGGFVEGHPYGAVSVPIFQTATFAHPGIGKSTGYDYSRESNPTRYELESVMSVSYTHLIVVAIALGFGITAFLLKSGKVKEYN